MSIKFKKTYRFALKSSVYITLFAVFLIVILKLFFYELSFQKAIPFLIIYTISTFLFSFFVIQYRVEVFIYRRVKKIYDDVLDAIGNTPLVRLNKVPQD